MNCHLLLFIAVIFLSLSWFNNLRHYLRIWIAQFRSQPSIAKHRRKNKDCVFPFPTKRSDCPLCQAEEMLPSEVAPEPSPLIKHKKGRPRSVYTDLHYCPDNNCEHYSWLARGNICNGHPNSYVKGQGKNDVVYLMKALSQLWYYRVIALPGAQIPERNSLPKLKYIDI